MAHKKGHKSYGGKGQKRMEDVAFIDLTPEDQMKRKAEAALNRAGMADPEKIKKRRKAFKQNQKIAAKEERRSNLMKTGKDVAIEAAPYLVGGALGAGVKAAMTARKLRNAAKLASKLKGKPKSSVTMRPAEPITKRATSAKPTKPEVKGRSTARAQAAKQTAGRKKLAKFRDMYSNPKIDDNDAYEYLLKNVDNIVDDAGMDFLIASMRGRVPKKLMERVDHSFANNVGVKDVLLEVMGKLPKAKKVK